MNSLTPLGGILAAAVLSSALVSCGGGESEQSGEGGESTAAVLRFTAIPDHESTELEAKFKPVAAYLSEQLGVPVEYVPTADYSASVEMFRNGDVHLAWFGGLSGVQARAAVDGSRAVAQGVLDPDFKTYFIVHESVDIEKSDSFPMELKGLSFTFGSPKSTSGRLMPEYFITQETGMTPNEFFGTENQFSGSHDKTAKLVEAGTFQAGAVNFKTYDSMVAEGKLDPEKCKIVWITPGYADYNWTVHPEVEGTYGNGFMDKVQGALLDMKDPELLKAVKREEGLIPATNEDFESIARLAAELGFLN